MNRLLPLLSVLMGVVVEGINFYGIQELSLFLCNNSEKMKLSYMVPIWTIWIFISLILLKFFVKYKEETNTKYNLLK